MKSYSIKWNKWKQSYLLFCWAILASCSDSANNDSKSPSSPRNTKPPLGFDSPSSESRVVNRDLDVTGFCKGETSVSFSGDIQETPVTSCLNGAFSTTVILMPGSGIKEVVVTQKDATNNTYRDVLQVTFTVLNPPEMVSSGGAHTCAVMTNSNLKCWGSGAVGQLGNGATDNKSSTPVDVHTSAMDSNPLSDIASVSAGEYHTCALTTNSNLKCWGHGVVGQLGNGTTESSSTPMDVHTSFIDSNPLSGIASVSAGDYHTCAVMTNSNVKCWGHGSLGLLGNRGTDNSSTPVDVHTSSVDSNPLSGIAAISLSGVHTCALTTNGNVKCWGAGSFGQLGDGATNRRSTPVDVHTSAMDSSPLSDILSLSAGSSHTCAVTTNDNVKCWGRGDSGQLGNGATENSNSSTPVDVHTSAMDSSPLSGIISLSVGDSHTCALTTNGNVKCWGGGDLGRLGNGDTENNNSLTPVDVHTSSTDSNPLSDILSLSAGGSHICAVTTNDSIKCWGIGGSGQLGSGDNQNGLTPLDVLLP